MDKNNYNDECTDETVPHLPMGQLFYMLHSNGFNVKPDDYIEMLKITERFGSANIDDTAKWICPIIATSESEQVRFYNIIEQYKTVSSLHPCNETTVIKKDFPRWFKIGVAILLVSLMLLAIYLSLQRSVLLQETRKERTTEKGEPLLLDASNLLRERPGDSDRIQFSWLFDDGGVQHGIRVSHIFKEPGDHLVKRQFSSGNPHLLKNADSLLIHVCGDLPKVTIKIPAVAVMVKQPVTIAAAVDADPGTVSYYQWTINDSVFTTATPEARNIVFSKEGDYPIECKAVVGSITSPCTVADNEIIQVLSNEMHYSAHFSAAQPVQYPANSKPAWWATLILLSAAGAVLLYGFLKRTTATPVMQENRPAAPVVTKGPYEIPFEQNDTRLIQPEINLRRAFIQMRYKAEEETMVVNIQGTISSIIRSGGSPQLVFAPQTQQQQYLILIDRLNPKSMLTHFFSYLVKSMSEDGIPVIVFYYDKNFVCYNDQHPAGLSLQRLADAWHNATLIIAGRSRELIYNVYPIIEEKFWKELSRWQNKAIVTPVPLKDWEAKEKVLQEYIILLPADVTALQKLIPALREKIRLDKKLLAITEPDQYTLRNTDFRDVNEIYNYLDKDEKLFQWLCAVCIYPRLKWEVFVAIGKAILDNYGEPESLNYSNLLKLCRIPWMQEGVYPQATRLELLKQLTTENELCARETLLHLLNYSTVRYGGSGHFFEEEKKRQVLTNQFILHANNSNKYSQYTFSKQKFEQLWRHDGILDVPVKKYLGKTGADNWQTPISDGKNSIGLAAYFDLHRVTLNKTINKRKIITAVAAFLLITCWMYIRYGDGGEKIEPFIQRAGLEHKANIPVAIKVIKNFSQCGDSSKNGFELLDGYLEIDNKKFPLTYNQRSSVASFEVPYKKFFSGTAKIMFAWNINKSVTSQLNFKDSRLPDSVTIGCFDVSRISKQMLYVRYNDASGYRNMETILGDALYGFAVTALPVDFTDSSRIVYYQPTQKARADSIVDIIRQTFNIHVAEEYIHEQRVPPATPILFLNTAMRGRSADIKSNSKDLAYDAIYYHRLGDDLMLKKQYSKAIGQYAEAIKLNPKDALAWYQTGICYEMMGQSYLQEAIVSYNAAIIIKADDPAYYYRRAAANYGLNKYAAAIKDYDKVVGINANKAKTQYLSALYFRGKSKLLLNNAAGACQDFKMASDAGYQPAVKEYGGYCSTASDSSAKPAMDYKQDDVDKGEPNVKQQQTTGSIPYLSAEQLSAMLLEVAAGKRKDTDFISYLRGNDIAVILNGNKMSFTEMCKALQEIKNISKLVAIPVQNDRNQITAITITVTGPGTPARTKKN